MSQQSIVFFDIDGTLLDHDKKLPRSTKEAIQELQRKGHIVAIATGRGPFMFKNLLNELGINTYVSYNGQYVVVEGEEVYTNSLQMPTLKNLTDQALANGHPVLFMDPDGMNANVPEHPHITESISELKIGLPSYNPHYYEDNAIFQSLLFCVEEEEQQYIDAFPEFDFVRWHRLSTDVLPKGGSKAYGIEKVMEKLHIPEENRYAFGDGLNDVEMLTKIPNSVAMGNGVEEAKNAAKYVTKSVDEDGILHGLKMVGLL
ncbi:Cof-type HAD-IIB family hydrolase [Ornithinibacillus sp. BX22]|uniref:Cof-type HAD-IIB family hydrolase n=1 Tax=Ornithinibacillus hominis TaxID=2763055 RepID=A0A923L4V3_9BACI|nr:Cof-type HAD-IIB family hydrolase [Ornithinibacillus hominis]MBC5636523.1 Cof-type HAD-IIB family hydrolase [Ornithinibacillus hominis]